MMHKRIEKHADKRTLPRPGKQDTKYTAGTPDDEQRRLPQTVDVQCEDAADAQLTRTGIGIECPGQDAPEGRRHGVSIAASKKTHRMQKRRGVRAPEAVP